MPELSRGRSNQPPGHFVEVSLPPQKCSKHQRRQQVTDGVKAFQFTARKIRGNFSTSASAFMLVRLLGSNSPAPERSRSRPLSPIVALGSGNGWVSLNGRKHNMGEVAAVTLLLVLVVVQGVILRQLLLCVVLFCVSVV